MEDHSLKGMREVVEGLIEISMEVCRGQSWERLYYGSSQA